MDTRRIKKLLEKVKSGEMPVDEALDSLRALPYDDCGYAKLDLHRGIRTGFPEVVFCQGKTCEQSVEIVRRLAGHHAKVLATRVAPDVAERIAEAVAGLHLPQRRAAPGRRPAREKGRKSRPQRQVRDGPLRGDGGPSGGGGGRGHGGVDGEPGRTRLRRRRRGPAPSARPEGADHAGERPDRRGREWRGRCRASSGGWSPAR